MRERGEQDQEALKEMNKEGERESRRGRGDREMRKGRGRIGEGEGVKE